MKKTFFMLLILMTQMVMAAADELVIENLNVTPGATAELPIGFRFDTSGEMTSYQFTLILPQGIATIHDANGRIDAEPGDCYDMTHIVTNNHAEEEGEDIFTCLSLESEPFIGSQGIFVTVEITADNTLTAGETLQGRATNILFIKTDGTKERLDDILFNIKVNGVMPTEIREAAIGQEDVQRYNLIGQPINSITNGVFIENGKKKVKR